MRFLFSFGPLFIILAALLWSADGLLRVGLYSLPPSVVVFYEHLLGILLLLLLSFKWFPDVSKMGKREWVSILVVSFFSGALGTIFYTAALGKINYTQYSVVVLLQQLQPIWAISAAALFLKEKVNKSFVFWAGAALVSAYFISFKDLRVNLQTGSETFWAGVLALLAGVMWGSSTVFSKIVLNRVNFLTASALRFIITPFIAFGLIYLQSQQNYLTSVSPVQWQSLFLIALTTGMVALVFYYLGLKKTPARVATICELVWPASAILIDYFIFKKTLSTTQLLGIALLLFSIYKVTAPLNNTRKDYLK